MVSSSPSCTGASKQPRNRISSSFRYNVTTAYDVPDQSRSRGASVRYRAAKPPITSPTVAPFALSVPPPDNFATMSASTAHDAVHFEHQRTADHPRPPALPGPLSSFLTEYRRSRGRSYTLRNLRNLRFPFLSSFECRSSHRQRRTSHAQSRSISNNSEPQITQITQKHDSSRSGFFFPF